MKFHILGDETAIVIDVIKRMYPEATDFWDVNWLKCNIDIRIPGYKAHFEAALQTNELETFYLNIEKMQKRMLGKAVLNNMEEYIQL
ncbi:hypothetical protein [Pseudalkalibacillus sp. SCS-8]|uniref:WapI family immunity protein n=1 Tax=Pseudalkalibacillus nanhaiensis TaxID=3115291 RepID=UPI0032DA0305